MVFFQPYLLIKLELENKKYKTHVKPMGPNHLNFARSIHVSCCKFRIYWVGVNKTFTTLQPHKHRPLNQDYVKQCICRISKFS